MCVCVSALLQKIDPLPLAVEQQLLPELQQLLVALHQEGRVVPADGLRAADKRARNKRGQSEVGDEIAVLYSSAYVLKCESYNNKCAGERIDEWFDTQ